MEKVGPLNHFHPAVEPCAMQVVAPPCQSPAGLQGGLVGGGIAAWPYPLAAGEARERRDHSPAPALPPPSGTLLSRRKRRLLPRPHRSRASHERRSGVRGLVRSHRLPPNVDWTTTGTLITCAPPCPPPHRSLCTSVNLPAVYGADTSENTHVQRVDLITLM